MNRRIGVATTSRADYSSLVPLLGLIQSDPDLELLLFVSGTHLDTRSGLTVRQIEADGFPIVDRIPMVIASDTQEAIGKSIGLGTIGFTESLARHRPDLLVIVGDRSELLAIVSSALVLAIPVAHISGGDLTAGALDDQVRHAVTKLSHLHFVAMEEHARRVRQMGEESWRIHVTGDPALDLLNTVEILDLSQLGQALNVTFTPPVTIVTLHPTSFSQVPVEDQVASLLSALDRVPGTRVFTASNADFGGEVITQKFKEFVASHPDAVFVPSLGQRNLYSLMTHADLMIGNSSSGIWEAPTFGLPVVNIGPRQDRRYRAKNVIDVDFDAVSIHSAIQKALNPGFKDSLQRLSNPYGDGKATPRILNTIKTIGLDDRLLKKHFDDLQWGEI